MQFDEEYFKSEDFREILDSYEAALATGLHPFLDADDLIDIADYYNYSGDADRAAQAADYAFLLYPHATLPNVFKAREALQRGDYATARRHADAISATDDPDYHYLKAEILIAEGRTDEADRYLRDYSVTVEAAEYQDFVKDCANLFIDYGVSDKAYEWMLRSKDDASVDFKELMARTMLGLGKYKDASRLFNELLDHDPYSKEYWNALTSAQYLDDDFAGAVASSEYALAIDPADPEALANKANGMFRLANYEEAYKFYQRYLQVMPDDVYGMLNMGACLVCLNRNEEAVDMLRKAVESTDDPALQAHICQELAFSYSEMRQPDKALEALDKTRQLPCDHIDMLVTRGHILLQNQRVAEASEAFQQAITLSDSSPDVQLRILVSLYDNHYLNACYNMFKQFFRYIGKHCKDHHIGYAYMALCCYDLKKVDEFLHYLQLAVRYNPQEAQTALAVLFPPDMDVSDYYDYVVSHLNARK